MTTQNNTGGEGAQPRTKSAPSLTTTVTPQVYVGTYGKYNAGNITGKWLELEDYGSRQEFLTACVELHQDETDPELMFQDYEGVPAGMISESHISDVWEWLELDKGERELVTVYQKEIDSDGTIEQAREAFAGKFKDAEDWAYDYLESTGMLSEMPDNLRNYFDFEAYARDAGYEGMSFIEHDGETWVFNNY